MFKDLREFMDKVEQMGELKVVEGADWNLEIGAITYLAAENPAPPALLFDKVKGYKAGYRVFTIPLSTDRRIALTLGFPWEGNRLKLVRQLRDKLMEPLKLVPPVEVKEGPILENIHTGNDVDLFEFPTPKWQSLDGGRYIGTGDAVILKDPDGGWLNVSVQRIQIHDKSTATIFVEPGRHAGMIREKYWKKGLACPVAVSCGSDPQLVFVAGSRIPWGISEYDYLGWWRRNAVEVIKGPTTGLPIPSTAEIVLEGEMVPPEIETRDEGPFSEWTGHYSPGHAEAAFKVKCILHRNDPIILGALPFLGPGATPWIGHIVRSAQLWAELDRLVPGVKGVWSHYEFGSHGLAVISLEQKYGGHAKQAALAALSFLGYMQKLVVVVDDDVDPSNLREVEFMLAMRSEPERYDIIRECYGGSLDPLLSPEKRKSGDFTHSSAIILACKPYHWMKDFPPFIKTSPELRERVNQKWGASLT